MATFSFRKSSFLMFANAATVLAAATSRLEGAEIELAAALHELQPSEQRDRRMPSERMEAAFTERNSARAALLALQPSSRGHQRVHVQAPRSGSIS